MIGPRLITRIFSGAGMSDKYLFDDSTFEHDPEKFKGKYGLSDKKVCSICEKPYLNSKQPVSLQKNMFCESCVTEHYDKTYFAGKKAMWYQGLIGIAIAFLFTRFVVIVEMAFSNLVKYDTEAFIIKLSLAAVIGSMIYGVFRIMTFRMDLTTICLAALPTLIFLAAPVLIVIFGKWWITPFWAIYLGLLIYFLIDRKIRALYQDFMVGEMFVKMVQMKFHQKFATDSK